MINTFKAIHIINLTNISSPIILIFYYILHQSKWLDAGLVEEMSKIEVIGPMVLGARNHQTGSCLVAL